ncbi:hypothetical protein GGR50DRAFT_677457 [Xylaria sp. CBS 124048]|nr:hypothetical protein GGR50DRAFT_677457 [Xylaria sp. CBS 124048]
MRDRRGGQLFYIYKNKKNKEKKYKHKKKSLFFCFSFCRESYPAMGLHDSLALSNPSRGISWLALASVSLPAIYGVYVLRKCAARTTVSLRISPPDPLVPPPIEGENEEGEGENEEENEEESTNDTEEEKEKEKSPAPKAPRIDKKSTATQAIPASILTTRDDYVIARERVLSQAISLHCILPDLRAPLAPKTHGDASSPDVRGLVDRYLSTAMHAFTYTPQALLMKTMLSRLPRGDALAETFSTTYLDACRFAHGDRVCGVYVVRARIHDAGEERIVLDLSPPEGWSGPIVNGFLDCGVALDDGGDEKVVRFVNEVVLWRKRQGEQPVLLEGLVAGWMHGWMVRWMMVCGIEAVTR